MREAEMKKDPTGDLPLSRAFARCQGVYLFEQCIQFPIMLSELYNYLHTSMEALQFEAKTVVTSKSVTVKQICSS